MARGEHEPGHGEPDARGIHEPAPTELGEQAIGLRAARAELVGHEAKVCGTPIAGEPEEDLESFELGGVGHGPTLHAY
jgi:hypothetical protein